MSVQQTANFIICKNDKFQCIFYAKSTDLEYTLETPQRDRPEYTQSMF